MKRIPSILYVVATPIGNLGDISQRAIETLRSVDLIAAEDTRHSGRLLKQLDISTPMLALHDHNEEQRSQGLLDRIEQGESVALISDAGTPLISDPGHRLITSARDRGVQVEPIPGPSAVITALSAAGIACDRFAFEGFLPAKKSARRERLRGLAAESRTLVFYESPHRIAEMLDDCVAAFGGQRFAVLARELTKLHESWYRGELAELCEQVSTSTLKGEMVVIVEGCELTSAADEELITLLTILLAELPLKQAAGLAARISGENRNRLYQLALDIQSDKS